jgi:hypothetical protein
VIAQIAEIDERLPNGVERRGADITIDDAERGNRQAGADAEAMIAPLAGRIVDRRDVRARVVFRSIEGEQRTLSSST